jgi:hypothetical protein
MALNTQTLISLVVIVLVMGMVLLRNRQARPLNVNWMWVLPLVYIALMSLAIWGVGHQPHPPFDTEAYAIMGGSLAVGAFLGWWRGKTIDIHRDAETNRLMAQASPIGLVIIFGFVGIRLALRDYLTANAPAWHISLVTLQDAFILFALGLIVVSRLEMWVRARGIAARSPAAA